MKRILLFALLLLLLVGCEPSKKGTTIHIVHTTDVHGNLFPYDFINDQPGTGGYARVSSYIKQLKKGSDEVLLLDGGDILQGQPSAYYYNFIDTTSTHIYAQMLEQIGYDAITIGNHDIETGHSTYDRFVGEIKLPVLGANVLREGSNSPYFQPFVIVQKGGRRIAVIGTTMPGLVHNLPRILWKGMEFVDQVATIKKYIPEILKSEPDLIVALIHSGGGDKDGERSPMSDNVGYQVAQEIPELDLVLLGHDHQQLLDSVVHQTGKVTYLLNPANDANAVSHTVVTFHDNDKGKNAITLSPEIVSLKDTDPDPALLMGFKVQEQAVRDFVSRPVATLTSSFNARSAIFRPTPFTDLIHQLQFFVYPEAQVSLTAPLDFDVTLHQGEIAIRDLFKLYRYENTLYLMRLSGEEIRKTLEESYDRWIQTMDAPEDRLIQIDESKLGGQYLATKNASFNFDSASGITYTVDVTKPKGERVVIEKVGANDFNPATEYKVAINSYRGNGGGGLLTHGGGIPIEELPSRVIKSTENDLRYYLIDFFDKHNPYTPSVKAKWSFEPKEWAEQAIKRDSTLLFSQKK